MQLVATYQLMPCNPQPLPPPANCLPHHGLLCGVTWHRMTPSLILTVFWSSPTSCPTPRWQQFCPTKQPSPAPHMLLSVSNSQTLVHSLFHAIYIMFRSYTFPYMPINYTDIIPIINRPLLYITHGIHLVCRLGFICHNSSSGEER